ncbi:hypothetical protein DES42_105109 [Zavarzinia compransoris]|nr:hypothetical protein DES42_105109 [Zavarzinia compransoris]
MTRRVQHRAIGRRVARLAGDALEPLGPGLPFGEVQRFAIEGPGGRHTIYVVLPPVPVPAGGYPCLYLLDGDAWIGTALDALRAQARFPGHSGVGPVAVVAIGYPGPEPVDLGRRARDFLPPHVSARLRDRFMQGAPWHQPGGAANFLDFLTGPLSAALARRYPLDMARRALCGHSFGGYFALYALLERPGAFRSHAAISPSLWWDGESLIRSAPERIAGLPAALAGEVLIAVAEFEMAGQDDINRMLIGHARRFDEVLAASGPKGLRRRCLVLAGENHQSALTAVFSEMLRFLSGPAEETET